MADKIFVILSSGDKEVALEAGLVYPLNTSKNGWMDKVEPHSQACGTSTFFGVTRRSISTFVPIGLRRITLPRIHPLASLGFLRRRVNGVPTEWALPINWKPLASRWSM